MPQIICYPIDNPNAQFLYCPSYAAAILFCTLFGITTICHAIQAIVYSKSFALVLIMGGAWETFGYIFRTISVQNQLNSGYATTQHLLVLLAPLWINAFVYMTLGRMIHFFLDDDRLFRVRARKITLIFVLFDVTASIVQGTGGILTTSNNPVDVQKLGLHIYTGGVALQLFFICIFITLTVKFQSTLALQQLQLSSSEDELSQAPPSYASTSPNQPDESLAESPSLPAQTPPPTRTARHALLLLRTIYIILGLIIFRNIYRLVEFSSGVNNPLTTHEWFAYVFDAVPMLAALLTCNIVHPGTVLRGARSGFSAETKEMKERKREQKKEKKERKEEAKRQKRDLKEEAKRQNRNLKEEEEAQDQIQDQAQDQAHEKAHEKSQEKSLEKNGVFVTVLQD